MIILFIIFLIHKKKFVIKDSFPSSKIIKFEYLLLLLYEFQKSKCENIYKNLKI